MPLKLLTNLTLFIGFLIAQAGEANSNLAKEVSLEREKNKANISIVTAQWENYTNADGSGLYFDIMKSALGVKTLNFKLLPWKRAQVDFNNGSAEVLLGETGGLDSCQYPKWPVDADFFSAYFLKSKFAKLPDMANLAKYKIIWVRGYEIDKSATKLKALEEVDDLQQGMQMVLKGRADFLIDYDQDMKDYLVNNKLQGLEHQVVPTEISGGLIYACFKKDKSLEPIVANFDKQLEKMYKSKELKKLFTKYNRNKNYNKIIEALRKK